MFAAISVSSNHRLTETSNKGIRVIMNTSFITEDLGSLWVLLKTVHVEGKEPKTYLSIASDLMLQSGGFLCGVCKSL